MDKYFYQSTKQSNPLWFLAGQQDRLLGSLNPHKEPFQLRIHVNTSIRVNQFTSDPKKNLPRFLVRNLTSFCNLLKFYISHFSYTENLRNQFYKLQDYNRTEEKPGNSLENNITIEKSVIQVGLEIIKLSKDCNQYFKPTLLGECNWNDESYKSQVTSMLGKQEGNTSHKAQRYTTPGNLKNQFPQSYGKLACRGSENSQPQRSYFHPRQPEKSVSPVVR